MAPAYEFVSTDGREERRDFVMEFADAVDIGATIEIDGRKWTRVFSRPQLVIKGFRPFIDTQQGVAPPGANPAEHENTRHIIADRWVDTGDGSGEKRPVYDKLETVLRASNTSKDSGAEKYLGWDDK